MFKKWLMEFVAVLIATITLFTPVSEVYAADYVKNSSSEEDGEATFYIIEGEDVAKLFDFGIYDMGNAVSWLLNFKTYTVIKNYTNTDGDNTYKVYFNAPNLQSIVKNRVISNISDGYTDDTYKVENTQWVVPVGKNASSENIITRYGFNIPSYEYQGEFPKAVMSAANLLPDPTWYELLWTAIKSLFGCSFIKAPDASTFNTITYLNHTYKDKNDYILDYFKKYYLDYFERFIPGIVDVPNTHIYKDEILSAANVEDPSDSQEEVKLRKYFSNAAEAIKLSVTEDQYKAAKKYNEKYADLYAEACARMVYYAYFKSVNYDESSFMSNAMQNSATVDHDTEDPALCNIIIDDMWGGFLEELEWSSPNSLELTGSQDNRKFKVKDKISLKTLISDKEEEDITFDAYHFVTDMVRYRNIFDAFQRDEANRRILYVLTSAVNNKEDNYKFGDTENTALEKPEDYYLNKDSDGKYNWGTPDDEDDETFMDFTKWNWTSMAADILRYAKDDIVCHVLYNKATRELKDVTTTVKTKTCDNIKVTVYYDNCEQGDSIYHGNYRIYKYGNESEWGTDDQYTDSNTTSNTVHYINGTESDSANDSNYDSWVVKSGDSDKEIERSYNQINPYKNESRQVDNNNGYKDSIDYSNGSTYTPDSSNDSDTTISPESHSPTITTIATFTPTKDSNGHVTENAVAKARNNPNFNFAEEYGDCFSTISGTNIPCIVVDTDAGSFGYPYDKITKITIEKSTNEWTETTVDTNTTTDYRNQYFRVKYLWDGVDSSNQISLKEFEDSMKALDPANIPNDDGGVGLVKDDFLPGQATTIFENYNHNDELINDYRTFRKYYRLGQDPDDYVNIDGDDQKNYKDDGVRQDIPYRQCMITNEGEDGECYSTKYGDGKTTLTVLNVYAYSGVYEVTQDIVEDLDVHELTTSQAREILAKLQSYCGPYYTDVLSKMMMLMAATAKGVGDDDPGRTIVNDDTRVMPFYNGSQLPLDRDNYTGVAGDPRVTRYTDTLVGGLVSTLTFGLNLSRLFSIQPRIISLCGKITELSVFMQQMCDFDVLDDWGLSPTTFWEMKSFTSLLLAALAIFFIFKTVAAVLKMGSKGTKKVLIGFLVLFIELGTVAAVAANPDGTWKAIKTANTNIIALGERAALDKYTSLDYMFGSANDTEVMYYLPYIDIWSNYNTGYGILASQQVFSWDEDLPELSESDGALPQIDGNDVLHWSVVLADAFEYHGHSNSVVTSIVENGKTYNGPVINNNAYRVVDHFMAPRVELDHSGDTIKMKITQNENFNNAYQNGWNGIITKMLVCVLGCLLSLIKMLTFLWFWFMLYIFIFKAVLGKLAERKKMSTILLETFAPLLFIVLIGLYSGIVLTVGMNLDGGIFGIILMLFMIWLTIRLVSWWHDLTYRVEVFPRTLMWMYILANMSKYRQLRRQRREELNDPQALNPMSDEQREKFNENTESDSVPVKHKPLYESANRRSNNLGSAFTYGGLNPRCLDMGSQEFTALMAGYKGAYTCAYIKNPSYGRGDRITNPNHWENLERYNQIRETEEKFSNNSMSNELLKMRKSAYDEVHGSEKKRHKDSNSDKDSYGQRLGSNQEEE